MLLKINRGHMIMGKSVLGDFKSLESRDNAIFVFVSTGPLLTKPGTA